MSFEKGLISFLMLLPIISQKQVLEWENKFKLFVNAIVDMTVGAFIEIYFRDKSGELKECSIKNKRYMIKSRILLYFEKKKMNEITPADIIQWQNVMRKKGMRRHIKHQLTKKSN